MYALVDCNNFYASCERVFRPELKNTPIVVLSNNDGCVIARSNEAKKIGIGMGAPAFKNQALFDTHHIQVFSANFELYGDMSNRIMNILKEYSPSIEIYSIDEAFLALEGFEKFDLSAYGLKIKKHVERWTGIPVSIGIAPSKALSKIANHIAKKFPKQTQGVHIIDDEKKRIKALKWFPIENVWGIGRQHAKRLKNIEVNTAWDFLQLSDAWIKKHMTIIGQRLKMELEGEDIIGIEHIENKKSIATTRTFESNYQKFDEINERVSTFAVSCAEKLRTQHSVCNTLMVFIHTNGFRKDLQQYSRNILIKLPYPTNSSIELSHFATDALRRIFIPGYLYKKAGVIVMDFNKESERQLQIFENSNSKHPQLMQAMDNINTTYGSHKVKLASQDIKRTWKMKQEKLSPRYTTRINDIITINAKN